MKIDKALSFSPATHLKLKIFIALYVTAITMNVRRTEFLNIMQNQIKVAISLGKHPKNTLAAKICSNTSAFEISRPEMYAMIWFKMERF